MTIRNLPPMQAFTGRQGVAFDTPAKALERWQSELRAMDDAENVINVMDIIGEDFWTGEGVTPKRVAADLQRFGGADLTVNVNSPGGDMFDGITIYNQLREYPGKVTVKVLGLAASAASMLSMAADEILIGRAGFFMIHNCWSRVIGDRNALREAADIFEPFDMAMAEVYAARSGQDIAEISAMMDRETWIGGGRAVELGFAEDLLPSEQIVREDGNAEARGDSVAAHQIDTLLARSGITRSRRRELIKQLKGGTQNAAASGMPGAAGSATQIAGVEDLNGAVQETLSALKSLKFS